MRPAYHRAANARVGSSTESAYIWPTPLCEHSLETYIYLLSPSGTECTSDCCIVEDEDKSALRALHDGRRANSTIAPTA
jgi:hypothetical protein